MSGSAYHQYWLSQQALGRGRVPRAMGPAPAGRARLGGRVLLNFSSNDYLGLSRHPALVRRSQDYAERWGTSAGAARLVTGTLEAVAEIEAKLARLKGTEAALVLGAGYLANATLLPALLDPQVLGASPRVYCDRLNHASLHHGVAAAGARETRYRHNDLDHLRSLLERDQALPGPRFIVSETVFSMDGDCADVAGLVELAERFGAFLYLDEAHATGVLGPGGAGLAAPFARRVDLIMGTFSKAMGAFGAYATCSAELRDYLVQRCPGFLYSTALPPPVLGAIDAALDVLPSLDAERLALQRSAASLRAALHGLGLDTGASSTQIVPALLGDETRALQVSRRLEEQGILAVAIRPPTVPAGTSRLRFSLCAAHTAGDLHALIDGLSRALDSSRGDA